MYESPKELLHKVVPTPLVTYRQVVSVAAALYIVGTVLPFLSSRIHYAVYRPAVGSAHTISTPATPENVFFAGLGTLAGPASIADETSGIESVLLILFDIIFAPAGVVLLPLLGMVIAVMPPLIALLLILGYKKHTKTLFGLYIVPFVVYILFLGVKGVDIEPHAGFYLILMAHTLLFGVVFDRATILDLIEGNGYRTTSTAYTTRLFNGEARGSNQLAAIATRLPDPLSKRMAITNVETGSNAKNSEDEVAVVYTGSAVRPED